MLNIKDTFLKETADPSHTNIDSFQQNVGIVATENCSWTLQRKKGMNQMRNFGTCDIYCEDIFYCAKFHVSENMKEERGSFIGPDTLLM